MNAIVLTSKTWQQMILCSICNIRARQPRRLTAVFFSAEKNGVDFRFIVKGLKGGKVSSSTALSRQGGAHRMVNYEQHLENHQLFHE